MDNSKVEPRKFPYPYRAMLAICSDLDETPDRQTYWEIMRFLNSTETTSMGPGVGLEVGNTIYFDMPPDQFAYWNTDDAGREMIRRLIRSGHTDCLHSYGDLATTREHAGRALDELARHDCQLKVWIDHGTAPTNFGADIMAGHGDEPGHPAYHADLTCGYGIKYVWRGRVTSVVGQDVPPSVRGLFDPRHPAASTRTILKEIAKRRRGRRGDVKYAMHGQNDLARLIRLRDGHDAIEFIRCNPHWGGVSSADTGRGLFQVLTRGFIDHLVDRGGCCILYTHLGKIRDRSQLLPTATIEALRLLADYHRAGKVLVMTTQRLLQCRQMLREARIESVREGDVTRLEVTTEPGNGPTDKERQCRDLNGLTIYVADPDWPRVVVDGHEMTTISRNGPDHTGHPSISLPWRPLSFPEA